MALRQCVIWLLTLIMLVGSTYAFAVKADPDSLSSGLDLSPFLEIIEDVEHSYSFEQIQSEQFAHLWRAVGSEVYRAPNTKTKIWFKFTIDWQDHSDTLAVLFVWLPPPMVDQFSILVPSVDQSFRLINTGTNLPHASRDIDNQLYAFKLALSRNKQHTIYGYIDNINGAIPAALPLYLYSEASYKQLEENTIIVSVILYSVVGAILLYNCCLFLTLRSPIYGMYLVFLVTVVITCMFSDGTLLRWAFPENPLLAKRVGIANAAISLTAYCTFVFTAINGKKYWPQLKSIYHTVVGIGIFIFLHNTLAANLPLAANITQGYALIVLLFTLVLIILAVRRRQPTTRYILLAEVMTISGSLSYVFMIHDVLPYNWISYWGIHWGSIFESILLSLALAAQTQLLRRQVIENFHKYEHLYENSLQGLFQFCLRSQTLKCNNSLATLLGFESKEVLMANGRLDKYQLDFWNQPELSANLFQTGHISNYEIQIYRYDNNDKIWVSIDMRLIDDKEGNPSFVEGSITNIDEHKLKEQEEKLREQAQQLALENLHKSSVSKKEFLSTISHELRTPMNGIVGYLELLKEETLDFDVKMHHDNLGIYAGEMMSLVDRILHLTEMQAGNLSSDDSTKEQEKVISEKPITTDDKDARNANILIVEDNITNQKILAALVNKFGHQSTNAINGIEALNVLAKSHYDLILMDCQMPKMDGFEATRNIRAGIGNHSDVPIIAVTANVMDNDINRCFECGMNDYLAKPINKSLLQNKLNQWL